MGIIFEPKKLRLSPIVAALLLSIAAIVVSTDSRHTTVMLSLLLNITAVYASCSPYFSWRKVKKRFNLSDNVTGIRNDYAPGYPVRYQALASNLQDVSIKEREALWLRRYSICSQLFYYLALVTAVITAMVLIFMITQKVAAWI